MADDGRSRDRYMAPHRTLRIVRLIAFPIIIAFLCILLLEVFMIVLEPYLSKGFYQYDPDLGFRVRPYIRNTNRFGFNDRDYPLQKDAGTFRVLVVSDSFNWAGGLEGNYAALLEKKFEEYYGGHRVDIINAGYPGTHTAEQLAMLKKYGLQYNPDLVFLGFFAGNDFIDADPDRKRIIVFDTYIDIDKRYEITFLGYPIIPKSRLFHFVKQKYKIYRELVKARRDTQTGDNAPGKERRGTFSEETFLNIERIRFEFCSLEHYRTKAFGDRIDYIFQSISEMKDLLDSKNIQFVVGIYPDEFQVNGDLLDQLFEKFDIKGGDYDTELMQKILREYLDLKGIPSIDFLSEFRTRGREKRLYLLRDTHWNDAGHELAAEIMFRYLLSTVKR
jgi:hypothetical protein